MHETVDIEVQDADGQVRVGRVTWWEDAGECRVSVDVGEGDSDAAALDSFESWIESRRT